MSAHEMDSNDLVTEAAAFLETWRAHPEADPPPSAGFVDDLRNAELAAEVRGAWWVELPERPWTLAARSALTVGSSRLRYGLVGELPLHRPAPVEGAIWMVGGRIEVRPEPSRRSRGWGGGGGR